MKHSEDNINYLWEQYLDKKATPTEIDVLFSFLKEKENEGAAVLALQMEMKKYDFSDKLSDDQRKVILEAVFKGGQTQALTSDFKSTTISSTHRVHFLKTAWFRYAAAIILMLGVASYLWFNRTASIPANPKNPINPGSDITAGGNKATLTLANGSTIILDNAQGNIIQQGKLKVINGAGKLDYEGVGTGNEMHNLSTPKGGQYQLILPDGSKVWLNAASSITYPTAFIGKDRTVTIAGEAYFEIANDKLKTFRVKTPREEITVLGTHFNVNAYIDETTEKTSLLEGMIKIGNTILKPGQAYINGKIITTNVEQDIAWKEGWFSFTQASLPVVMRQLARWYNVEIIYESKVPDMKFNGEIDRDITLSQALKILAKSNVKYRMESDRRIVILPNE